MLELDNQVWETGRVMRRLAVMASLVLVFVPVLHAGEVETREQAIGYIENLLETEDND